MKVSALTSSLLVRKGEATPSTFVPPGTANARPVLRVPPSSGSAATRPNGAPHLRVVGAAPRIRISIRLDPDRHLREDPLRFGEHHEEVVRSGGNVFPANLEDSVVDLGRTAARAAAAEGDRDRAAEIVSHFMGPTVEAALKRAELLQAHIT